MNASADPRSAATPQSRVPWRYVVSMVDVVKSTGTDLVWLILLVFFISRGVIKSGLGRRVALVFVRLLGKRTLGPSWWMVLRYV